MDAGEVEPPKMKVAVLMEECMSYFSGDYSKFFPQEKAITKRKDGGKSGASGSGVF